MLTIDGSQGEGGGQVLRSSLALSMLTGTPFRIRNIRAGRKKPGLLRQHLTAVKASAQISDAEVTGASLKSQDLMFKPGKIRPGDYTFAVGTAGSANLVLQTILPALMLADGESQLTLKGGTHNPSSPPFHYLKQVFLPLLGRMGPQVELDLETWGFYPAGGGSFAVSIRPTKALRPLELHERGEVHSIRPRAVIAVVPRHVGRRELNAACAILEVERRHGELIEVKKPFGPGNVLMIEVESQHLTEMFIGFGKRGIPAEEIANQVCREVQAYLSSDIPVGEHLADQLLLPMALAGSGSFRTGTPSLHTTTNIEVIRQFLDIPIQIRQEDERRSMVIVG